MGSIAGGGGSLAVGRQGPTAAAEHAPECPPGNDISYRPRARRVHDRQRVCMTTFAEGISPTCP